MRLLLGRARLAVGTRAAAFAPVPRLGLAAIWDDDDTRGSIVFSLFSIDV